MKSKRKQIEGALGAFAPGRAQRWLDKKSPRRAEELGERLGRLFLRLSKKHRNRALENLRMAMPELSDSERHSLARKVFEHFGRTTASFLRSPKLKDEDLLATTEATGLEHLDQALAAGKGAILISGHFGNWERMSAYLSTKGYALSVIARDADSTGITKMVNEVREAPGTRVIPRGNSARPVLELLKANELVGILPDQNSAEVFIPFFGKPCGTVLGPGVLSERTGAPVIPCWCVYVGPNQYRLIVEPPLVAFPGGEVKGEGMMRAINAALEHAIRQYPDQWLWFHNRWKSARAKGLL